MQKKFVLSVLLGVGMIYGCTTQPTAILKSLDLNESAAMDARLRVISSAQVGATSRPGRVDPKRITCAEPSPDVALAVANSFGAGISIFGQGAGSLTGAAAEQLLQLAERSATIQMLRDQSFRACEAYANGAISGTTYSLLMADFNDTMVTLMIGETAGGRFGRSLGAIGTTADASATASADFTKKLGEIAEDLEEESKELDEAETEAANAAEGSAEEATAEAEAERLRESVVEKAETASLAAAGAHTVIAGGGITARPSPALAEELGEIQNRFLRRSAVRSMITSCLIELGLTLKSPDGQFDHFDKIRTKYRSALGDHIDNAADDVKADGADSARNTYFAEHLYLYGSHLAEFCNSHLPNVLASEQRNAHALNLKRVTLAAAATGGPALSGLTEWTVADSAKLAFERASAVFMEFKAQKARLDAAAAIPADTSTDANPDPFKIVKQKLTRERDDLTQKAGDSFDNANQLLSEAEATAAETLDDELLNKLIALAQAQADSDTAILTAEIDLARAKARKKRQALDDLRTQMSTLTAAIRDHLTNTENLARRIASAQV